MNENVFRSTHTHTRLKFQPLTTSCALVLLTPQSPMAQIVDVSGSSPAYIPHSRNGDGGIPCVIYPDVRAFDPDGVFPHGSVNEYLTLDTLQWYIDGKKIETVWTADVDYEVVTDADDVRGAIRIMKNLSVGEKATLSFRGSFLDWRTGLLYPVSSDEKTLTCSEKGADKTSCSVDKPEVIYNPLEDGLLLWEHLYARGLATGNRADHLDGKCYEQAVNIIFSEGDAPVQALPSGVDMRLYRLGESTPLTPGSVSSPEVMSIAYPTVKFDMRMIVASDYEIRFEDGSTVLARATVGVKKVVDMPVFGKPRYGADIPASKTWYENRVLLNLPDRSVDYPELYYAIRWKTQAMKAVTNNNVTSYVADTPKEWQLGEIMACEVKDTGIGKTKDNSFFDISFEVQPHEADQLLSDEDDDVLLDENNEYIIG